MDGRRGQTLSGWPNKQKRKDTEYMKTWCIKNSNGEYWLNGWGWVVEDCSELVSIFTDNEKENHKLSIGEVWEQFQ